MNRIIDTIDRFRQTVDAEDQREHQNNSQVEELNNPGQEFETADLALGYITADEQGREERTLNLIPLADAAVYQRALIEQGNILLDVFNSNGIYLCERREMNEKVSQHMTQTGAYLLMEQLNNANRTCVGQYLNQMVEEVNSLVDNLHECQGLSDIQVQQMRIVELSKVQMNYLFFLPDPRQCDTPFQPIMVCCVGPTINIARFIHRLVQPVFDHAAYSTTFFKGSDAVRCLEVYQSRGLLQSNTLLVNLHIHDLCTIIPYEQLLEAFERFLKEFVVDQQIQCVSIETLLRLAHCVLKNQYFVFKDKIYRQIKGCGSGSPLNQLLANICVFYWQEDLVQFLTNRNEIVGRCLDEIFLTWNGSKRELQTSIRRMVRGKHPQLFLTTTIGTKVTYLDIQISHINGRQLQTRIHHPQCAGVRTLPFLLDHPFQVYSTLIQACLIRTALVCSKVSDFQAEHHDIEDIFLKNGFTMPYIREHVEAFYEQFQASEWNNYLNADNYKVLRQRVLDYDQQRTARIMSERKEEQIQHKWFLSTVRNGEELFELQRDINRRWQQTIENEPQMKDVKIEIVHRPKYPANTK